MAGPAAVKIPAASAVCGYDPAGAREICLQVRGYPKAACQPPAGIPVHWQPDLEFLGRHERDWRDGL